jgi:biopolymer transport protein ExbD
LDSSIPQHSRFSEVLVFPGRMWTADRVAFHHAKNLPRAIRKDTIWITVRRDGSPYFRNSRVLPDQLPNKFRDAVLNGAEKRIYLNVDARAKYGDVNALQPYIQLSGVENLSILAESPYPAHF